jgi:hypothetical protein
MSSYRKMTPYERKERKLKAALMRQLSKAPETDLRGVVGPLGSWGGKSQGDRTWTGQFKLSTWRTADGAPNHTELTVLKPMSERAVMPLMRRLPPYEIIRFRARLAVDNVRGKPHALLVRITATDLKDKDLRTEAAALHVPSTFRDKKFGRFKLNRGRDSWESPVRWGTRRITLCLEAAHEPDAQKAAAHARRLWGAQRAWHRRIIDRATSKLLKQANTTWLIEGDKPVTAKQFAAKLKLESVDIDPKGKFTFAFDDGDLFGGHVVIVRGSITKGPNEVSIEG